MKRSDFQFYKKDKEYEDHWFRISGETKDELTNRHMEQSMIEATEVVYSKVDDVVGVRTIFPFNAGFVFDNDPRLREILLDLVQEVDEQQEVSP